MDYAGFMQSGQRLENATERGEKIAHSHRSRPANAFTQPLTLLKHMANPGDSAGFACFQFTGQSTMLYIGNHSIGRKKSLHGCPIAAHVS
jgi:hypothetical protein